MWDRRTRNLSVVLVFGLAAFNVAIGPALAAGAQRVNGGGTATVTAMKTQGGGTMQASAPARWHVGAVKQANGHVHGTFTCAITGMSMRGSVKALAISGKTASFSGSSNFGLYSVRLSTKTKVLRLTWATPFGPHKVTGTVERLTRYSLRLVG